MTDGNKEQIILDDNLIYKKIRKSLKLQEFSFKIFGIIMAGALFLAATSGLTIYKISDILEASFPGARIFGILLVFVVGMGFVFAGTVLSLKKAYVIRMVDKDAFNYLRFCRVYLANVLDKKIIKDEKGNNLHIVSYQYNNKAVKVFIEEQFYDEVQTGSECYFLECPASMRNDQVTRVRTYVFPRSRTTYDAMPDVRDIRTDINPFR